MPILSDEMLKTRLLHSVPLRCTYPYPCSTVAIPTYSYPAHLCLPCAIVTVTVQLLLLQTTIILFIVLSISLMELTVCLVAYSVHATCIYVYFNQQMMWREWATVGYSLSHVTVLYTAVPPLLCFLFNPYLVIYHQIISTFCLTITTVPTLTQSSIMTLIHLSFLTQSFFNLLLRWHGHVRRRRSEDRRLLNRLQLHTL